MRRLVVLVLVVMGFSLAGTSSVYAWNGSFDSSAEEPVKIPIIIKSPFKPDDPHSAMFRFQPPLIILYAGDPNLASSMETAKVSQDNIDKESWYVLASPGIYQIKSVLAGPFFIKSITSGSVDLMPDDARLVIKPGVKPDPIVIVLDAGASLRGTTSKNGKPVAAKIIFKGDDNLTLGNSAVDSEHPKGPYSYEFPGLRPGKYQICAVLPDEFEEATHLFSSSRGQPGDWCKEVKSLTIPEHGDVKLDLEVQNFKGGTQALAAKEGPVNAPAKNNILAAFSHETEALLLAQNFDKLEATANELRRTNAKFPGDDYPKLGVFYSALGSIAEHDNCLCGGYRSAVPFETKRGLFQKWMEAQPKSLTARVAMAQLWMNYAWYARGGGYAAGITQESWKKYFERLEKGGEYLKDVDPKADPYVYMEYIELVGLAPSPRQALDAIYMAGVQNYPDFFPIYVEEARLLEEKWYGRPGEVAAFMGYLLHSPGGKNGQIAFADVATYEVSTMFNLYRNTIFEKMGLPWPLFRDAYRTKEKQYGLSNTDWNAWWVYCFAANDNAVASEINQHIRIIAEQGDTSSQVNLGMSYEMGLGVEKNPKEAMNWYRLAADQGSSMAKNNIGALFEKGLGVPQDYVKAGWWYQTAADAGNARAKFHIALMYYKGLGTPRNEGLAYNWMQAASEGGEGQATQWLAQHPQQEPPP